MPWGLPGDRRRAAQGCHALPAESQRGLGLCCRQAPLLRRSGPLTQRLGGCLPSAFFRLCQPDAGPDPAGSGSDAEAAGGGESWLAGVPANQRGRLEARHSAAAAAAAAHQHPSSLSGLPRPRPAPFFRKLETTSKQHCSDSRTGPYRTVPQVSMEYDRVCSGCVNADSSAKTFVRQVRRADGQFPFSTERRLRIIQPAAGLAAVPSLAQKRDAAGHVEGGASCPQSAVFTRINDVFSCLPPSRAGLQ